MRTGAAVSLPPKGKFESRVLRQFLQEAKDMKDNLYNADFVRDHIGMAAEEIQHGNVDPTELQRIINLIHSGRDLRRKS